MSYTDFMIPANENLLISKSPMIYNFENWGAPNDPGNNVLFIIGLPGSGKTTLARTYAKKYNAKWMSVDEITTPHEGKMIYRQDSDYKSILERLCNEIPKYQEFVSEINTLEDPAQLGPCMGKYSDVIDIAIQKAILYMMEDTSNKWILEGVSLMDGTIVTKKDAQLVPIIILRTSVTKSVYRYIKRYNDGKFWSGLLVYKGKRDLIKYTMDLDKQIREIST